MLKMRLFTIAGFFLLCAPAFATESAKLEERMSEAEFKAAGLNKLSTEELSALNAWLAGEEMQKTIATGNFYPDEDKRERIESRINGAFTGWRGNTIFKLENGQEWQQAESGIYSDRPIDHPAVKIKPMLLGSWLMWVDSCGCSVRVKRIR